jgi:hypothetical protein
VIPAIAGGPAGVHRHQTVDLTVRHHAMLELLVMEVLAVLFLGKQDHDRPGQELDKLEQVPDQKPGPADLRGFHQVHFADARII